MAKIPRLSQSDTPSAVPRGEVRADPVPGAIVDVLGTAAGGFANIAAQKEAAALKARAEAKEKWDAIQNEIKAGELSSDFEQQLRDHIRTEQEAVAEDTNPADVIAPFMDGARKIANSFIKAAPNSAVGLMVARVTTDRISQAQKQMDDWARDATIQRARGMAAKKFSASSRDVAAAPDPQALTTMLSERREELRAAASFSFPAAELQSKLDEWEQDTIEEFVRNRSPRDPWGMRDFLDAHPLGAKLSSASRKALRSITRADEEGYAKTQRQELLAEGISSRLEQVEAYRQNPQDPALPGAIWGRKKALREKRVALEVEVAKGRMTDAEFRRQSEELGREDQILDALDIVRRSQDWPETDDTATAARLRIQNEKLFEVSGAEPDLPAVRQFLDDLILAARAKQITPATFARWKDNVMAAMPDAAAREAGTTGRWRVFDAWRTPRQLGNRAIGDIFKVRNASPEVQERAYSLFIDRLNASKEPLSPNEAKKAAKNSAYEALGLYDQIQD